MIREPIRGTGKNDYSAFGYNGQENTEGEGEGGEKSWGSQSQHSKGLKPSRNTPGGKATSKGSHRSPSPPPLLKTRQAIGIGSFWDYLKPLGAPQGWIKALGTVQPLLPVGPEFRCAGIPLHPLAPARFSLGTDNLWEEEMLSPKPER